MSVPAIVQARFRTTTPLFLGGAEPQKRCELRPASIRGVLAFWWRATRPRMPADELRRRETELFGSAAGGRGRLQVDAWNEGLEPRFDDEDPIELGPGRGYLAGLGLTEDSGPYFSRSFFWPGGAFRVRCILDGPRSEAEQSAAEIREALLALSVFGGFGARSRRGFGSVALYDLAWPGGRDERGDDAAALRRRAEDLLAPHAGRGEPEYTALSGDTRALLVSSASLSVEELHETVGERLQDFRNPKKSDIAQEDVESVIGWLGGDPISTPPRRAVFGMPHNYHFPDRANVSIAPAARGRGRRASPLFLHLDEVGEDDHRTAVAVITFLPARFLPAGDRIKISAKKISARSPRPEFLDPRPSPQLWEPIREWLDAWLESPPRGTSVTEITPGSGEGGET